MKTNVLYYGDNLGILRHHIPDESVDLFYLDPPYDSVLTCSSPDSPVRIHVGGNSR